MKGSEAAPRREARASCGRAGTSGAAGGWSRGRGGGSRRLLLGEFDEGVFESVDVSHRLELCDAALREQVAETNQPQATASLGLVHDVTRYQDRRALVG